MHRAISSTNFDHFQPVSKWFEKFDTTPSSTPFHSPFFSPRRDKLEVRVSTLFPCTAVCLALCMKQRQHFIRLGCKSYRARVYQRVFSRRRQPTRETTPPTLPTPIREDASSSSRSCRAFQITGISARVGINIEIFLWATNRRYWKTYPPLIFFFECLPPTFERHFLLFFFVPVLYQWEWFGRIGE